jgi:hypothetical protein
MKRLFRASPATKTVTHFHHVGDEYILDTQQDVTAIVEATKAEKAMVGDYRPYAGKGMKRVARIPLSVLFDPKTKLMRSDEELRKWLNDPANAVFRTMPGRV